MNYTADVVVTLTDEELLEACSNYEGMYQAGVIDEPEMYSTWFEEASVLNAEAIDRGFGCQFERFWPIEDDEPEWEDYPEEPDDTPEEIARAEMDWYEFCEMHDLPF